MDNRDAPNLELEGTKIEQWRTRKGMNCEGLTNDKGVAHGIMRQWPDDGSFIAEKSVRNAINFGLNRAVTKRVIEIFYNVDGKEKAFLAFNLKGKELSRNDPQNYLVDLEPSDFLKNQDDQTEDNSMVLAH